MSEHDHSPQPLKPTLVTVSAATRLIGAVAAIAVLWLAVWWATR